MVQYLISHEKVIYYLKFLSNPDSRTIIVGLQELIVMDDNDAMRFDYIKGALESVESMDNNFASVYAQ